jgi:adenosylcobinamide-phosphate synthase
MFTFGLAEGPRAFDPLVLLLLAMVLEGIASSARVMFQHFPSLLSIVSGIILFFNRKLNRKHRSQMDRAIRGVLVTIFVILLCLGLSTGVLWVAGHVRYGWTLELILTASLLTQGQAYGEARSLAKQISASRLDEARSSLEDITNQDATNLDGHAVCRIAIENTTEKLVTGVVGPVFWFILFGFPGLFISRAVHTMAKELDRPTDEYRAFGLTAGRLDDALMFIPARIACLFVAMAAAFAPTAHPGEAMKTMGRDAGEHPSVNLGWPLAAMAGALSLSLAGPRPNQPEYQSIPWIGDGTARVTPQDVSRALYVYGVACLINLAGIAGFAVLRYGLP